MPRAVVRAAATLFAVSTAACVEHAPITSTENTATRATAAGVPSADVQLAAPSAKSYVINFTGTDLPGDLGAQVAAAGGAVTASVSPIGVAIAESNDPGFAARAAKISGVASVDEDVRVQWVSPERVVDAGEVDPTTSFGATETFRLIQWAPDAISAPAAWDLGARGAGARVAILDGGIYSAHVDIAPNLDVAHSRSFVPGQPFNFDQSIRHSTGACDSTDTFWHGTHVAGIVAAPGQNIGTIGIAPDATIIGVKVLHCGNGFFSWIIQGIVYAATPISEGGAGADVINLSLGALFPRQGSGLARLADVVGKATTYAYQRGTLVVAALGNNAADLDHTANLVFVPAMSPHVIAVSATGPVGWALGATNFDRPASYTNFGQSAVGFAAPGGDAVLPGLDLCAKPLIPGGVTIQPCWVFDLVIAPRRGSGSSTASYAWAAGTSMAAPAVSGVAALIVGRFGHIGPAAIEARLRHSADDLGKPGNDDFYGGGRVNAMRAVQ
jgi:lantibiotic leader peptide-processing serine protease